MTKQNDPTGYVDAIQRNDPGRRVQFLNTAEEFDAVPYMTDEAKRIAKSLMQSEYGSYDTADLPDHGALKRREPSLGLVQRDPETLQRMVAYFGPLGVDVAGLTILQMGDATTRSAGVDGVTNDPEIKRKFRRAMLMCFKAAHMNNDEWFCRLQATIPKMFTAEQCSVIGNPNSSAWSDEDRLTLRFTYAFLRAEITDELFEEVNKAWNPKVIYQNSLWIGMYHTFSLIMLMNITDAERKSLLRA